MGREWAGWAWPTTSKARRPTLAERSMAAGHHRTALGQLRGLAVAERLDSDVAFRLTLAMTECGTRAGALR